MTRPAPTACCPDAYWCPTDDGDGETECPRHGGFDVCCAKPEAHVPMDRQAWHQAQEDLERRWLDEHIRAHRAVPVQNPVLKPRRP